MSLRKVTLVLACLACTCHGRPAQTLGSEVDNGMKSLAILLHTLNPAASFNPSGAGMRNSIRTHTSTASRPSVAPRVGDAHMFNLFGNTEESKQRRKDLALRDAPAGSKVVTFRKPNTATSGLVLGLKFKESWGKNVYIEKILPGTEADRLKKAGQIREGDEVVMCSATFGDEMWSSRGIGKQRLEKSIAIRQGQIIQFVVERSDDADKQYKKNNAKQIEKEQERMKRMQKQLASEVRNEQAKGGFFNLR